MPRFFSEHCDEQKCYIFGSDALHISKSLRMKIGESLTVCDQKGTDYDCLIECIDSNEIALKVLRKKATLTEPNVQLT